MGFGLRRQAAPQRWCGRGKLLRTGLLLRDLLLPRLLLRSLTLPDRAPFVAKDGARRLRGSSARRAPYLHVLTCRRHSGLAMAARTFRSGRANLTAHIRSLAALGDDVVPADAAPGRFGCSPEIGNLASESTPACISMSLCLYPPRRGAAASRAPWRTSQARSRAQPRAAAPGYLASSPLQLSAHPASAVLGGGPSCGIGGRRSEVMSFDTKTFPRSCFEDKQFAFNASSEASKACTAPLLALLAHPSGSVGALEAATS